VYIYIFFFFPGTDNVRSSPPPRFSVSSISELERLLSRELLWMEAKDVWCLNLEPVWVDFYGASAVGSNRPVPFLDAFPLTLWIYLKMPFSSSENCKSSSLNGAISAMRKDSPTIPASHSIPPTQTSSSSCRSDNVQTNIRVGVDKTGIYFQGYKSSEIGSNVTDFSSCSQSVSWGFRDASKVNVITHMTSDTSRTCAVNEESVKTADVHMLTYVSNLVSIQINHYQFLFLLRLSEEAAELATYLALDSNRILKQELSGSVIVGALIPQVRQHE
jgi:hypothetical protein